MEFPVVGILMMTHINYPRKPLKYKENGFTAKKAISAQKKSVNTKRPPLLSSSYSVEDCKNC